MENSIFMSIHEVHVKKIVDKIKDHEFRNYIPKKSFNRIYVYVSVPIKSLKYVLDIGEPIEYPNKINEDGVGNKEFNDNNKSKFAYPINKIYEIKEAVPLEVLKKKYGFTPPQGFAYGTRYPEIIEAVKDRLVEI